MAYRRRRIYRRVYRRKDEPVILDMLFDILVDIVITICKLLYRLFDDIFRNRNNIKGLFKINDNPTINLDTETQIPNNAYLEKVAEQPKVIEDREGKYSLKESQITEAEIDFLETLEQVVGQTYRIGTQVPLSSIIGVKDSTKHYTNYTDFNRIKAKTIDFVLFDNNRKPYLAIELDDRSHFRWDRMKRDEFINDLMEEVGLRIIHIPVSRSYKPEDLRIKIFIK